MKAFLRDHPYLFTGIYFLVTGAVYWLMLGWNRPPQLVPCSLVICAVTGWYFWLCYMLLQQERFTPGTILNVTAFTLITLTVLLLCYATLFRIGGISCTVVGFDTNEKLDSLYFSGVTWTTVGYGDFVPKPGLSRFCAVVEAIHSYMFLAVFVSLLIHMLTHLPKR